MANDPACTVELLSYGRTPKLMVLACSMEQIKHVRTIEFDWPNILAIL